MYVYEFLWPSIYFIPPARFDALPLSAKFLGQADWTNRYSGNLTSRDVRVPFQGWFVYPIDFWHTNMYHRHDHLCIPSWSLMFFYHIIALSTLGCITSCAYVEFAAHSQIAEWFNCTEGRLASSCPLKGATFFPPCPSRSWAIRLLHYGGCRLWGGLWSKEALLQLVCRYVPRQLSGCRNSLGLRLMPEVSWDVAADPPC